MLEWLERTHDSRRLVQLAAADDSGFTDWMDVAIALTPYGTAYRYPGESAVLEPSRDEFDEPLQFADQLVEFVVSALP